MSILSDSLTIAESYLLLELFTCVRVVYVQRDLKLMVSFRFIALWRLSAQIYRHHFNFPPIAIIIIRRRGGKGKQKHKYNIQIHYTNTYTNTINKYKYKLRVSRVVCAGAGASWEGQTEKSSKWSGVRLMLHKPSSCLCRDKNTKYKHKYYMQIQTQRPV